MGFREGLSSITGFAGFDYQNLIMIFIALTLIYLAVKKKYEPLLLLPLAFGMLMANIPAANMSIYPMRVGPYYAEAVLGTGQMLIDGYIYQAGLMFYIYQGVRYVIFPPLIFLCIGAMTDFGPLISSPKSALIGIGGQFGIFAAFGLALLLGHIPLGFLPDFHGFTLQEAASIGIIGSSDGPTAIFTASVLSPQILPIVAIAAYSYMALTPIIQPPIMRLLTTEKERQIVMPEPKVRVSKTKRIVFPIAVTAAVFLLVPAAAVLVGMLMLGNLIRESGVTDRYARSLPGDLLNILTMAVGLSIGASASAEIFLTPTTIIIVLLGLFAFAVGTAGGVLIAKILCKITGGKVNPLIGNSGISAMPMSARVSQKLGQEYNPDNHLLMHAMGPLVSSIIGSAIVAGIFLALFGG